MRSSLPFVLAIALACGSQPVCAQAARGVGILEGSGEPHFRIGKQHLVVIAVNRYEQWIPLSNPVLDAREIRDILVLRYHVDELYELYDEGATKANILRLFVALQQEVQADDSLLVVYAGHGHLDRSSNTGFWIPVNAGTDVYEQHNWLPHTQLKGLVANIAARHVLVISDSCFAGDLIYTTRSLPAVVDDEYFRQAYSRVSRQVITSGAAETVPDESAFAAQLKSILRRNNRRCLDALMLYNEVRLGVRSTIPLLGSLSGTGHQEGASFLLFLKEEAVAVAGAAAEGPAVLPWPGGPVLPVEALPSGPRRRRLFATIHSGPIIPVGAVAGSFEPASPCVLSRLDWAVSTSWGDLAVGLLSGWFVTTALPDGIFVYGMRSHPLAVTLRVSTPPARRVHLVADAALGVAINHIGFFDDEAERLTVVKPFASTALGIGVRLFKGLSVSAGARFVLIKFDQSSFTAFMPEVVAGYRF